MIRNIIIITIILFPLCTAYAQHDEINMHTLMIIESSGNPYAVSNANAYGLFQIRKIALDDYNQFHKEKYSIDDLFNSAINKKIADWMITVRIPQLLRHYGIEPSKESILQSYNLGTYAYAVNGKRNDNYVTKYLKKEK